MNTQNVLEKLRLLRDMTDEDAQTYLPLVQDAVQRLEGKRIRAGGDSLLETAAAALVNWQISLTEPDGDFTAGRSVLLEEIQTRMPKGSGWMHGMRRHPICMMKHLLSGVFREPANLDCRLAETLWQFCSLRRKRSTGADSADESKQHRGRPLSLYGSIRFLPENRRQAAMHGACLYSTALRWCLCGRASAVYMGSFGVTGRLGEVNTVNQNLQTAQEELSEKLELESLRYPRTLEEET